jgi:hypothetical protein
MQRHRGVKGNFVFVHGLDVTSRFRILGSPARPDIAGLAVIACESASAIDEELRALRRVSRLLDCS